jgi:hypothetical protein
MAADSSISTTKRNRTIAVAAGTITVVAIVLAFASGYLGERWLWLRPAGELLLLAELVGLIVLERHQLFEPVHSTVAETKDHVLGMMQTLSSIGERLDLAGQATLSPGTLDTFRAFTRIAREALTRNHDTTQVFRLATLSGAFMLPKDPEVTEEYSNLLEALYAYLLLPTSSATSPARHWSIRNVIAFADLDTFERYRNDMLQPVSEQKPLNFELKFIVRPELVTLFYPLVISDREVLFTCHDFRRVLPLALVLRGEQYAQVFAHWLDELWASIPNTQLVYSRNGLDEKALERIRAELAK